MKYRVLCLLLALVLFLSACAESSDRRRDDDEDEELNFDFNQTDDADDVPAAPARVQSIYFQRAYDNSKEYAVIVALDENDETVWQLETQQYDVAQLDSVTEIGLWNDRFYYVEGGKIVALDRESGEKLWENKEFQGRPAGKDACLILEDGTIVVTGYFGPDLTVVDKDGELLAYLDTYDTNIFWPYDVVMDNGVIVITFEGSPYDTGETKLTVDPETWEVSE